MDREELCLQKTQERLPALVGEIVAWSKRHAAIYKLAVALGTSKGHALLAKNLDVLAAAVVRQSPFLADELSQLAELSALPTLGGALRWLLIEPTPPPFDLTSLTAYIESFAFAAEAQNAPPAVSRKKPDRALAWARELGVDLETPLSACLPVPSGDLLADALSVTTDTRVDVKTICRAAYLYCLEDHALRHGQDLHLPTDTPWTVDDLFGDDVLQAVDGRLQKFTRALSSFGQGLKLRKGHDRASLLDSVNAYPREFIFYPDGGARAVLVGPERPMWSPFVVKLEYDDGAFTKKDNGDVPKVLYAWLAASMLLALVDRFHPVRGALIKQIGFAPWERLVAELEASMAEEDTAAPKVKVVWAVRRRDFSLRDTSPLHVRPMVARRLQNGGWSVAKRTAPIKLALDPAVDEEDRHLLRLLAEDRAQPHALGKNTISVFFRSLLRRGGADLRLEDTAPGVMLSLERGVVGAAVHEEEGGYRIDLHGRGLPLAPSDVRTANGELIVLDEERSRLLVLDVPDAAQRIAAFLGDGKIIVPRVEGDRFVEALTRTSHGALDVKLPPSLDGRMVRTSDTVFARCVRLPEGGVDCRLGFRPLGERFYAPGQGVERVLGMRDGARVQVLRDFEYEDDRARHIAGELALYEGDEVALFRYRLDLDVALAVMVLARPLRESGELVIEWADEKSLRVKRPASASNLSMRAYRAHDWFHIDGELVVDEQRVNLKKLLLAVQNGKRFVALDDDHFIELQQSLQQQLQKLAAIARINGDKIEVGPHAALLAKDLVEDGTTIDDTWRGIYQRATAAETVELPRDLRATLRPYQEDGLRWLLRMAAWQTGAILADDMGLGKTVQMLGAMLARKDGGPAIVVAPTSVAGNWIAECQTFAPALTAHAYEGKDRQAVLKKLGPGQVLVCSYAVMVRDHEALAKVGFHTAVFDEAQALKNAGTKRNQAARKLKATWNVALTGTPIENHLGELWAIFHVVSPGLFGSQKHFRDIYIRPIERGTDKKRQKLLTRAVQPFLLRRKKSEVALELPARTEMTIRIDMSDDEKVLYEAARQRELEEIKKAGDARFQTLAAITRLRLLACHPRLFDPDSNLPSSKLDRVLTVLEDLRQSHHRALVFSQFVKHLDLVEDALVQRGFTFLRLDGSTPAKTRRAHMDRFQNGEADVFLISLKAGGTGINLTAADYVLHLDPWWNPAVEDQATDRAHRIGQTRPVTVMRFVMRGSIEENILKLHEEKREMVDDILRGTGVAGSLSIEQLVAMVDAPIV